MLFLIVTVKTEASLSFSYSFRIEVSRFCVIFELYIESYAWLQFSTAFTLCLLQTVHQTHQFKNITQKSKIWRGCRPFWGEGGNFHCVGRKGGARSTAGTGACCMLLSVGTAGQTNTTTRTWRCAAAEQTDKGIIDPFPCFSVYLMN